MQKHNEWLSNKGYLRHLEVLSKISQRKTHSLNRTCPLSIRRPLNDTHPDPLDSSLRRECSARKDNSMRDHQLLWDNYCLGRRIIETPPVISKKKMDQQYKRHKLIVQSMAASSNRKAMPTDFRVKKLQEYKENLELHCQDLAQQAASHHNFINIVVNALTFYRQGHPLDNISFLFVYPTRTGKRHRQSCESFPAEELLGRNLCFGISKRLVSSEQPQALLLELRNMRGLEMFSIGCASFPSGMELSDYKAQLCHFGKPIGEVQVSTAYNRRVC